MDMNLLGVKHLKSAMKNRTTFCFTLISPSFNPIFFLFVVLFSVLKKGAKMFAYSLRFPRKIISKGLWIKCLYENYINF